MQPPVDPGPLELPVRRLAEVPFIQAIFSYQPVKLLFPIPILIAVAPPIWWYFRSTWREFDREAAAHRTELEARGQTDYRPAACFLIAAVVLTIQDYFGGRPFYEDVFRPGLRELEASGWAFLRVDHYDELYGYIWWALSRAGGYVLIPFPIWKILFPQDRLLDFGLRLGGFFHHIWIYGACLAVVLPVMLVVAHQPDFGSYYPFYKQSSRSWLDFGLWESFYFLQFLGLEIFFRGWMVGALRPSLGSASVFAMTLPYCMIHYGKPYFEAHGAIVAGVVLGSLALKTRSIYAGFLTHVTVALGMDMLALYKRGALPTTLWAAY